MKLPANMHSSVRRWLENWEDKNKKKKLKFKIWPVAKLSGYLSITEDTPDFGFFEEVTDAYEMAEALGPVWGDFNITAHEEGPDLHYPKMGTWLVHNKLPTIVNESRIEAEDGSFVLPKAFGQKVHPRILRELLTHDTGQLDWDNILISISGKDADLITADMGIAIDRIDHLGGKFNGWYLLCSVHYGATFDALERVDGRTNREWDSAMDAMMNSLPETYCLSGIENLKHEHHCEWSGDDWHMSGFIQYPVSLSHRNPNPEHVAKMVVDKAKFAMSEVLESIESCRKHFNQIDEDYQAGMYALGCKTVKEEV